MLPRSRVPLAWLNLTHSKRRFLVSVVGITFAVILMFVELGFWRALLDSQTAILRKADADLFLVSASTSTITDAQAFPLSRIVQARGARRRLDPATLHPLLPVHVEKPRRVRSRSVADPRGGLC